MGHNENSDKIIALYVYMKKLEKSHTSTLTEQKVANSPRRNRQQEIMNLRAESNKIGTNKTIKNQWDNELVLWENQQDRQTFIPTNQKAEREYPNQQNQKWKGVITTDMEEIQKIIRLYFKNLYFIKLENLKEMNNFLGVLTGGVVLLSHPVPQVLRPKETHRSLH